MQRAAVIALARQAHPLADGAGVTPVADVTELR